MASRSKHMVQLAAVWASASLLLEGTPAQAGSSKAECIAAYEHAQRLKQEGSLVESKQQLLTCMRDVCPDMLKKDCDEWLRDVERAMPSVAISAKGSDGHDLTDVQVTLDGKVVTDHLDGRSIPIDPGNHVFHFVHGDLPPIDEKVLVRVGEKNRPLTISFRIPKSQPGTSTVAADTSHAVPLGAYIFGGVGVLALGSFGYFGLAGRSDVDEMQACKPHCAQSDVDKARTKLIVADSSLGVGVLCLGIATYLYLSTPSASSDNEKPSDTSLRFDLMPLRSGGFAGLSTRF